MASFNRLAKVASDSGRIDDAIALYERAIEIGTRRARSDDPIVVRMALHAYVGKGDLQDTYLQPTGPMSSACELFALNDSVNRGIVALGSTASIGAG